MSVEYLDSERAYDSRLTLSPALSISSISSCKEDLLSPRLEPAQINNCHHSNRCWNERKQRAEKHNDWIASLFSNTTVSFIVDGTQTEWTIGRRLKKEKKVFCSKLAAGAHGVSAIFECHRVDGKGEDLIAICKIYLEVSGSGGSADIPDLQKQIATVVSDEVTALQRLTAMGVENPGPRILASKSFHQTADMWLLGGHVHMILMQKLHGITLDYCEFWSFPLTKRDELRAAFTKSHRKLFQAGIWHNDEALRNLIWDDKDKKCYIVDFEDVDFLSAEETRELLEEDSDPSAWLYWGLRRSESAENGGL